MWPRYPIHVKNQVKANLKKRPNLKKLATQQSSTRRIQIKPLRWVRFQGDPVAQSTRTALSIPLLTLKTVNNFQIDRRAMPATRISHTSLGTARVPNATRRLCRHRIKRKPPRQKRQQSVRSHKRGVYGVVKHQSNNKITKTTGSTKKKDSLYTGQETPLLKQTKKQILPR